LLAKKRQNINTVTIWYQFSYRISS